MAQKYYLYILLQKIINRRNIQYNEQGSFSYLTKQTRRYTDKIHHSQPLHLQEAVSTLDCVSSMVDTRLTGKKFFMKTVSSSYNMKYWL